MTNAQLAPLTLSDKKILEQHDNAITLQNAVADVSDQIDILMTLVEHLFEGEQDHKTEVMQTAIFNVVDKFAPLEKLSKSSCDEDEIIKKATLKWAVQQDAESKTVALFDRAFKESA